MHTRSKSLIVALLVALIMGAILTPAAAAQRGRLGRAEVSGQDWTEFGLGLEPSTGDFPRIDARDLIGMLRALPSSVDLSANLPPVASQGGQGSCVGWATAYYMRSWQEETERGWGTSSLEHRFSPSYVYTQRNTSDCSEDKGMTFSDGLRILRDKGAASLATFPYYVNDPCIQPPQAAHDEAAGFKIESYGNLWSGAGNAPINDLKGVLAAGQVFLVGVPVYYPSFYIGSSDPVVRQPGGGETYYGGHALLVVGYDDAVGGFKFVNSWGTGYGAGGFGYLEYDFVAENVWEGWFATDTVDVVPETTVPLYDGWNMVSLTREPTSSDPATVFAGISSQLEEVFVWDADEATWLRYMPDVPAFVNTLTEVTPEMGLWLRVNADVEFSVSGSELQSGCVGLNEGWNLVPFPGAESTECGAALQSMGGNVNLVYGYDAIQDLWLSYQPADPENSTLAEMVPGAAYWVEAVGSCTWSLD